MQSRAHKIKALLRENSIEGAIVSSPENFHYVTGSFSHQHTVSRQPSFSAAVFTNKCDCPVQVIVMDFEKSRFEMMNHLISNKYDTWVGAKTTAEIEKNAYPQKSQREDFFTVLFETVKKLSLKKIGLEMDFISHEFNLKLQALMPEVEFVNISQLFILARSVKTPEEISMFERLTEIQDNALNFTKDFIKVDASEKEISDIYRLKVVESKFCLPSSWSMFSTGGNCSFLGIPTETKIADGDIFKYDGGVNAEFDFYTTDFSRSFLVGSKNNTLVEIKERLFEAQRKMLEALKPGLPLSELFQIGFSHVNDKYKFYERGHLGHSISMGPQTAEAPFISPAETRVAEEGMVLCVEVPMYIKGLGGFNIEDMVVVTKDGCKLLTHRTPHFLLSE